MLLACRILGAAMLLVLVVAAFTPASELLADRYAERARLEPADAIFVLGGGIQRGELGDPSLRRAVHGIRLQRQGLAPLLVFGGDAPPAGPSEPELRARLARDLGVPPAAIVTVRANTTREEAIGAAAALRPRGVRRLLLVSGSLHLIRARGVFEREGFEVFPAPADVFLGPLAVERVTVARTLAWNLAGWLYYRLAGYL
jgi:uncharacterized SAM-binding protein YcdF (DUF218 family)